ncbi:hypothetical protein EPO04_00515 [Patescibacteria group bacterium]|nr:MAG: hypothetical protein EPO04_00515 [Patescibacteria group bacterium]
MSYRLTEDQWRIVLLIWDRKKKGRHPAQPFDLAAQLGLSRMSVLRDLGYLVSLEIVKQDVGYQCHPAKRWPSEEMLCLMEAWRVGVSIDEQGEADVVAVYLTQQNQLRFQNGQKMFRGFVAQAIGETKRAENPLEHLVQQAAIQPSCPADIVRRAAYQAAIEYWQIRPLPNGTVFDSAEGGAHGV